MIKFERRLNYPRWLTFAVPVASIVLAAIITGIVLAATDHDPFTTYHQMYQSAITAHGGLTSTFVYATPMLFAGLAAAIAFRMRVWNIGGEGQIYMGAVGAAGIGLALGSWPRPLLIAAMMAGGIACGLVFALIPGILRAYFRTNEILVSLMLNYAAGYLIYYLIYDSTSYWRDMTSFRARVFPLGKNLEAKANWPVFKFGSFVLPFGFVVGIVVALLLLALIRATRYGFEMNVIGDAPAAADYAGIRTKRKIVSVMAVSGAVAGLGGASQIGDFGHTLDPRGLQQAGYGYTGIVVAALGLYNPLAVVLVSFLIGALTNAGYALQGPNFPVGLVGTTQGIILFCVLGGEILARYRIRFGKGTAKPPVASESVPVEDEQPPAYATAEVTP